MASFYPPGASGPPRASGASASSPERTARVVSAVITVVALIGVLLIALVTSDKPVDLLGSGAGGGNLGNTDSGSGGSSGGGGAEPGVAGTAAPSGVSPSGGSASQPTGFPSSAAAPSGGASSSGPTPTAAQVRKSFARPPGTKSISKYDFLKPDPGDLWYLTTTSIAATNRFYAAKFKADGWITYIAPAITRNGAGKPVGYFYIFHLDDAVTTELELDADYLGKTPGQVLIRATVSDD